MAPAPDRACPVSLQSVEQMGIAARDAQEALRAECVAAAAAGVPQAAIARSAGVARNTVRAWVNDASTTEPARSDLHSSR